MLGHYENFPETIHGIARFTYKASSQVVQQAIVQALYQLGQGKCKLEEITHSSTPNCEVALEFGIGEEVTFTFLDRNEVGRLEAEIAGKQLALLDFLCALQYHVIDESKKRYPLKFDYYLLRFTFSKNFMEFLLSHERGPRRVHVEDLIRLLTKHVKKKLADQHSVALELESVRAV